MTEKKLNSTRRGEGVLALILALALLCLLASLYLNHLHYKVHTDSSFNSICALSQEVNCETVALSPYSVFLGLPISWWGIVVSVLYMAVAALGLMDVRRSRAEGPRGFALLAIMGGTGVVVSCLLFYVAHFVIKSLCPFCMAIYVLQLMIATTMAVHLVRSKQSFLDLLKRDAGGYMGLPGLAVVALPVVLTVGGYVGYPRVYDTTACPEKSTEEDLCTQPLMYGKPDAPIKIVEYSDYQCPFCSMTHFALRQAVENYPEDVSLEHVHFPLDIACNDLLNRPFHGHACETARASVCAERQDRFWDFNDWLYTHQKRIGRKEMSEIAKDLDLDVEAFDRCMQDPTSLDAVIDGIERAKETKYVKQGQVGTPIIFINDKSHMGAINYEELEKFLVREFGLPPTS